MHARNMISVYTAVNIMFEPHIVIDPENTAYALHAQSDLRLRLSHIKSCFQLKGVYMPKNNERLMIPRYCAGWFRIFSCTSWSWVGSHIYVIWYLLPLPGSHVSKCLKYLYRISEIRSYYSNYHTLNRRNRAFKSTKVWGIFKPCFEVI